jgi:hypothetical protein
MSRRITVGVAVALFLVALAGPAGATLVTLTGSTLTVAVGALPPVAFPQNVAGVPIAVSSGGGFTEPAGIFTGSVMLPTSLFTGVPLIHGFTVAGMSNAAKQIAPGAPAGVGNPYFGVHRAGGGLGGPGRLTGRAIVNVLALFNLNVPLFPVGYTDDYSTSSGPGPTGGGLVTVFGTGWTTGDVTLTGVTTGPTPINTVTFQAHGFDQRTPGHAGVLHLVSPFKVVSHAVGNLPGYALQSLTFAGVPEPGSLLLLALGVSGLVAYGISRRS